MMPAKNAHFNILNFNYYTSDKFATSETNRKSKNLDWKMSAKSELTRDKDGFLKCKDCPRRFLTELMFVNHSSDQHKKEIETKLNQNQHSQAIIAVLGLVVLVILVPVLILVLIDKHFRWFGFSALDSVLSLVWCSMFGVWCSDIFGILDSALSPRSFLNCCKGNSTVSASTNQLSVGCSSLQKFFLLVVDLSIISVLHPPAQHS